MTRTFLTRDEVKRLPRGSTLKLDAGLAITPTGMEEATVLGIRVVSEDGRVLNSPSPDGVPGGHGGASQFGDDPLSRPVAASAPGTLVVVSAVGRNRPRVLAEITATVAELNGDVQDITQRVLQGYFNLLMLVDIARAAGTFADFKDRLEGLSRDGDYKVLVQHEEVFQVMFRV